MTAVSETPSVRPPTTEHESVITWQAPPIRFGPGALGELGYELRRLGAKSTLIVTDARLAGLGLPARAAEIIAAAGIKVHVFAHARIEPTDESCVAAARETASLGVDSYVGLGGGSSIDTAKIVNLLHTFPDLALRRFLNRPVGEGLRVPGPLRPLVAVPTTAGSGSECTAMVALGLEDLRIKTGISDLALRPSAAVVDPLTTVTLPPGVTASSGYDVLTHACESYTARAYDRRPPYADPAQRPLYIGANPVSDVWAEQALILIGRYFRRAVLNPWDLEARTAMSQAASFAAMGFGNAGTHIPHACAYPVAGRVHEYQAADYPTDHPMVPHGEAVVSTAPAAFAFTYPAAPERHVRAAELLGAEVHGVSRARRPGLLPDTLRELVADTGGPSGVAAFGYRSQDIAGLTEGALQQQRLLSCCPREVGADDLRRILEMSLAN
ncbi:hydroxyacid-oxoacid transhydrogenase [Streptomyces sp. NPDC050619]|uniref:hydroxyacid-oxoacid transhydrogenase n=1 Tax=Streptomyces sp. NPDC050619 TaxID=3157214 RepID=UPI003431ED14